MGALVLSAILSSAFLQADELDQQLKKLVEPLGSEKPEERETARAELSRLIARNRAVMRRILRERLKKQKDPEVRAAFLQGVSKTYSMEDLSFEVVLPKDSFSVREAGSSNMRYRIRVRNNDDEELVLIRNFKLEVLDPEGKPLKASTWMGAGVLPSGCFLAAAPFLTIPGGHVMEWDEGLSGYEGEMRVHQGFEPPAPGVYTLRFSVAFDRAAFSKTCIDGCAGHDNVEKPWSRALEGTRTFDAKLVVREATAEDQAAAAKHEKWMNDLMDRYRAKKIGISELHQEIKKAKLDYKDWQRVLSVTRE